MNKEDRIRDSKKIYDATEIPSELSETVHQADVYKRQVWVRSAVRHFARRVDGFRHRTGCRPFGGEIIGGLLHWINWEYMWFRSPCC